MTNERKAILLISAIALAGVVYHHLTTGMWEDKDEK